ncbi:hypothetical protein RHMOL_Rhmol09G0059700 [Rhododendron molle]|uniref:Uncharacterized protein n=1 Tax=Rhododendron molle TaxID=49168 RepID=A0ACC0MBL5_RHOML|nr:hypothetical protein RHMOL_Rhmol09G0059700 [Rhododendron molle]
MLPAMNRLFLPLLISLAFYSAYVLSNADGATDQYIVSIVSVVPNNPKPLRIHCRSGDDDLGYHDLKTGEDFHWSFRLNFFSTTRFYCHFWWDSKDKSFDVFYYYTVADKCQKQRPFTCYWIVRPEGFYLSNGNATCFPGHLEHLEVGFVDRQNRTWLCQKEKSNLAS